MKTFLNLSAASAAALALATANAQTVTASTAPLSDQGGATVLEPVMVQGHYDNAVGTSDAASAGQIRRELLKSRPAQRPGEVLEFVPGVIVTQHSGDGKANQYFLRGFNLDHGTDFATSVNGMPVNMPTHGHGQGYTDLNFLIPELVDKVEYRKGPYFARNADFASAGSADIAYLRSLERPFAQLTLGERSYRRAVAAGSTKLMEDHSLLGAIELHRNDGPWTLPERLKKVNALLSLSQGNPRRGWSASLMGYDASWDSTDQVPQRAIDAGTIGRFDAIDPTDGGKTSRFSLSGEWHDRADGGGVHVSAYAMRYRLNLFSNFTYALDRPAQGDQFEQSDSRGVYGVRAAKDWEHSLLGRASRTEVGVQLRHDRIKSSLALWELRSDSELVYVGDAGTTEANRPSRRQGIEWNNRWIPVPWFLLDADLAWSKARFREFDPAGDRIPGAVERVASVAATVRDLGPWSASLQWRYLGPRPLIEDNSVRALATLLTNLRIGRKVGANVDLTLDVFNLLDRKVNDIEYFYESRLASETASMEDRHVHPVEPRTVRLTMQVRF